MNTSKKILIIEDDIDLVEAMKVTLESEKYQVISSYHPEDGFLEAEKVRPDLIILDVMFENKHKALGFDYALKMKQDSALASIPILMISAINAEHPGFHFSPATDGEFIPVDDFIEKPAQPEDLIEKTKHLLQRGNSKWMNWPNKNE